MTYTFRPYQSTEDLYEIGRLIRRAYAQQKHFNSWSFCRFDIWAQRRIADAASFDDKIWQEHFRLVSDENGSLLGAAFAFDNHHWRNNPEPYALMLDPSYTQVAEGLMEWAESDGMCEVEIMQGNRFLTGLIQSRGYTRSDDFMFIREKPLIDTPFEPVNLPPGYFVRILDPLEWNGNFEAVEAIFHMMDTPEALASIQWVPSNVHELHLNVVTGQNQIAAFCSVWLDHENSVAEFEPVGTVPDFQKQGLGAALMAYACNRLREMNCPTVKVESWSESVGANKLYSAAGFAEQDWLYNWRKGTSA